MILQKVLLFLSAFLLCTTSFSQTNVQGTISANTTWTASNSPYAVTGSLTIRDGATLTIESGVEVRFTGSYYITVGYSFSSRGTLTADGVTFRGLLSSDARIYFKNSAASGQISNCTFDNTYVWIENNEITVNNSSFDNCVYPIILEDGGKIIQSNLVFGSNNQHYGIEIKGTVNSDYLIKHESIPKYIDNLVIQGGAVLTIENGTEIYFPSTTGITIGNTSSSTGNLQASNAKFKGVSTSDTKIYFKNASGTGTINNCTFDNSYFLIENTQVVMNGSNFLNCNYPIILEDEGSVDATGLVFGSNVSYPGIGIQGTIKNNYNLQKKYSPFYVNSLTVRDNAQLSIENQSQVFFPSTSGITLGYSSSSTGRLTADQVEFTGLSGSDAQLAIKYNSQAQISNCVFNNAYLNIDNSSPSITNSRFTLCSYAIATRNNANPVISHNDFFQNNYALKNYGTNSITAENNFWGDFSGPTNVTNPGGLGDKIDGLVDFQPFGQSPYVGSILPTIINSTLDFGEQVVGAYKELIFKIVTSDGSVSLFIKNFEIQNSAFSVTSTGNSWITNGDTALVKIKFTPQSAADYSTSLLIHTNQLNNTPLIINISGKGISPLSMSPTFLDFGQVDLKSNKTLSLVLTNVSSKTVYIDSIKSTNANFVFVIGSSSSSIVADYDETRVTNTESYRSVMSTSSLLTISPGKTKTLLVTFKPTARAVENAQLEIYRSTQTNHITLRGEGFASPLSTNITSLNYQNFPFLFLNASVDTFNVGIETLTASNFEVYEDGIRQLDNLIIIPPGQSGGSRLTDIIFIMDNSGSMQDEQNSVAANVNNFVNQLSASGVDFALGLCRYGSATNNGNPIIEENGILTSDAYYFKNNIWTRNSANGSREPGYYAIQQAASSFAFRPGAQKIFIIITDENPNQGGATVDQAHDVCTTNQITFFALTNSSLYSSFTTIAFSTNGEVYDIHSDFQQILTYISTHITSNYLIQYKSSDPNANSSLREVVLKVTYGANTATDTVYYNPGAIPKIQRTDSTLAFHSKAWTDGTSFKIQVVVTDDIAPFVQRVIFYYKSSTQSLFSSLIMTSEGNNKYYATIPGSAVHAPGLDYYITASDGNLTASDPKLTPSSTPYQIAILPNVAPNIIHNIVEYATKNTNVLIDATVTDITNQVSDVKLYYRKVGQLTYQTSQMNLTSGNNYGSSIPASFVVSSGVEYFIKATDDFGVNSFHGTVADPHQIGIVALSISAQLDTLTKGPSIKNVSVPDNGTGYCYFTLNVNGNQVYSSSTVKALLVSQNDALDVEGIFLKRGVFRLDIPHDIVLSSAHDYTLGAGITVSDTFYTFNSSPFVIAVNKIPSPFQRTWTVFAGGSAGVSGLLGGAGVGVSASAAKLSVKGSAGAGLGIMLDQDDNLFLDRRLEVGVSAEVQVPNANLAVASATVATVSSTMKEYFGQQFSFTGLGLDDDKVRMAQSGFILETMALAGIGLSPAVGVALSAIVGAVNATAGMIPVFNSGLVKDYVGIGLEGNFGIGLKAQVQGFELNALSPSLQTALNFNLNKLSTTHPSNDDNTYLSNQLSQALSFNFSALDFGLKANDKVTLGGSNFSLFDAGVGAEVGAEVKLNPSLGFNGMKLSLKGGGGLNLFNAQRNIYYSTDINFPKEFGSALTSSGSSVIALFTKTKGIPLGSELIADVVQTMKSSYSKITSVPIEITSSEIQGNGYQLDLGIDIDAAFGLGLGLSFGINGKYYDEVVYPRKVTDVYLNGENYLVYTNNYSDVMKSADFTSTLRTLFSGVLPLIKQSFLNIVNTLEKVVVAGKEFIINAVTGTGEVIGDLVGVAQDTGTWIVTTFTSHLPSFAQVEQFENPVFSRTYKSRNVLHSTGVKNSKEYISAETNLVVFSKIMNVAFKKNNQTVLEDTVGTPFQLKMLVNNKDLVDNNFSWNDSSHIALYYYDKNLLNWIYIGGTLKGDTVIAEANRTGSYALGIELSSINDTEPPEISDYGPQQGSIWETYPAVYAVVHDNKFGSGLDLVNSSMKINGNAVDFSFDPGNSKIVFQTDKNSLNKLATNYVEIVVKDLAGNKSAVNFEFRANITSVEEHRNILRFELLQNYPNPFNPTTKIKFSIPKRTAVAVNIFDVKGSLVKKLFYGELESGIHEIVWDGKNNFGYKVASGVYFYQIKADGFNQVKKMQLIK